MNKKSRKKSKSTITIVNQFFPPDFAATGQLLNELSKKLSKNGIKINIITGMPSYASNEKKSPRKEIFKNRLILRSKLLIYWPKKLYGRLFRSIIFFLSAGTKLLKKKVRGDLIILTSEPPFLPILGWLISKIINTPYILIIYDLYPDILVNLKFLKKNNLIIKLWKKN